MIVIGNDELVLAMRFCGITRCHVMKDRDTVLTLIASLPRNELVIANSGIIRLVPELGEFPNLASIPDRMEDFDKMDDLKDIVKSAIGVELEGL